MKRTSRRLLNQTAESLNRRITDDTALGKALRDGTEEARECVELINEILRETAEGATLVVASETDGTLLGFVPRADVVLPDHQARPSSPGVAAQDPRFQRSPEEDRTPS